MSCSECATLSESLRASEARVKELEETADEHALFDAETDHAFKDLDHQIETLTDRATTAEALAKEQAEIVGRLELALEGAIDDLVSFSRDRDCPYEGTEDDLVGGYREVLSASRTRPSGGDAGGEQSQ